MENVKKRHRKEFKLLEEYIDQLGNCIDSQSFENLWSIIKGKLNWSFKVEFFFVKSNFFNIINKTFNNDKA